jgi:hypothetical protein
MKNDLPQVGQHITVPDMPGRGGTIDKTSTAPGELIVRAEDHWYLGGKVVVGTDFAVGLDGRQTPA